MKRSLFALVLAVIISLSAQAQSDYQSSIGGRLGTTYYDVFSFSYKTFITKPGALELNAGFGSRGYHGYSTTSLSAAVTYQHHFDINAVAGLQWYIGGGAVIYNTFAKDRHDDADYKGFGFGLYPTGGVDYKFSNIPLNLSTDIRPTFLVVAPGYYNSFYPNFGIAARYTLGGR